MRERGAPHGSDRGFAWLRAWPLTGRPGRYSHAGGSPCLLPWFAGGSNGGQLSFEDMKLELMRHIIHIPMQADHAVDLVMSGRANFTGDMVR